VCHTYSDQAVQPSDVTGRTAREPRPNLYSGRMRLYLSRTDYDTPQDYLLRARTPATAPWPLALPTRPARAPHYTDPFYVSVWFNAQVCPSSWILDAKEMQRNCQRSGSTNKITNTLESCHIWLSGYRVNLQARSDWIELLYIQNDGMAVLPKLSSCRLIDSLTYQYFGKPPPWLRGNPQARHAE